MSLLVDTIMFSLWIFSSWAGKSSDYVLLSNLLLKTWATEPTIFGSLSYAPGWQANTVTRFSCLILGKSSRSPSITMSSVSGSRNDALSSNFTLPSGSFFFSSTFGSSLTGSLQAEDSSAEIGLMNGPDCGITWLCDGLYSSKHYWL